MSSTLIGLWPYKKRKILSLPLPLSSMWGHSEKVTICKPGREFSPDTSILDLPSELWEVNFCCLSPLVYGILLWQPEQTNTLPLMWSYEWVQFNGMWTEVTCIIFSNGHKIIFTLFSVFFFLLKTQWSHAHELENQVLKMAKS